MGIKRIIVTIVLLLPVYGAACFGSKIEKDETYSFCQNAVELTDSSSLDDLMAMCEGSRLVLLGESTHGTAEFYQWRAEISKRLIAEQGVKFVVVEADWVPMFKLNLYVKGLLEGYESATEVLREITRWPDWMWRNTEFAKFAEWLRAYNESMPIDEKVGIFGMDVYGQWQAMDEVLTIVEELIPHRLDEVKKQFDCYAAYNRDEWQYATAVKTGYPSCYSGLGEVIDMLVQEFRLSDDAHQREALLYAMQCAEVVKNSEEFYRLAVQSNITSWNSRAMHMHKTVQTLLQIHGSQSRAVVWAHNSHIGDARATGMLHYGMHNIGQLSRETYGENAVKLIGFTAYKGHINAGLQWGHPMEKMRLASAKRGSFEHSLNQCGLPAFYTIFEKELWDRSDMLTPIDHRGIGVEFNPLLERTDNYAPAITPLRYNAIVFIKKSTPLRVIK